MEYKKGKYLTRISYYEVMQHQYDDLKNNGFDWRNKMITNSVSGYLLSDPKRYSIIQKFQEMLVYVMDYASQIKKAFNYTVNKNYKYLN